MYNFVSNHAHKKQINEHKDLFVSNNSINKVYTQKT